MKLGLKRFFGLLCAVLLCGLSVTAQVDQATMSDIDRINAIKGDTENYLYSEVTMADWTEACDNAKTLLKEKIRQWLTEQNIEDATSYIAKSDTKFLEIKAQRGSRFRAFVYVKKSDVVVLNDQVLTGTLSGKETQSPVTSQSSTTSQSSAQSSSQTPDAPQKEEPTKKEEPSKKEAEIQSVRVKMSVENDVKVGVANDAKGEENNAKAGAESATKTGVGSAAKVSVNASQKSNDAVADKPLVNPMKDLLSEEILKVQDFEEVPNFLAKKKEQGILSEYGKYAARPTAGKYYLLVFDSNGSKVDSYVCEGDKLTNLKTQKPEDLDIEDCKRKSYRILWFR